MELKDYREKIDAIDADLTRLFTERMETAAAIAAWKRENAKPVLDASRERQKLVEVTSQVPAGLEEYTHVLYSLLFELSRAYQERQTNEPTLLSNEILSAIKNTDPLFPPAATVACQGVEGAYSQLACERLFRRPSILYFRSFEGVFSAIESGLCRYGIVPVENSTAGSVDAVYDLMLKHHFCIVRSVRLKVDHNLMAKHGTRLEDVREIFSHEQALHQCAGFLSNLGPNVKITACENTAAAAKAVAESDRADVAALCSRGCAELYSLDCLAAGVQDRENNYTRFLCISRKLEIYPGADRTSLMMVLPHRPGSLYKALARFYSLGINLLKLESRPLPGREFEFMFYFDLETSVYSKEFAQMLEELSSISEECSYLGSYTEVV